MIFKKLKVKTNKHQLAAKSLAQFHNITQTIKPRFLLNRFKQLLLINNQFGLISLEALSVKIQPRV